MPAVKRLPPPIQHAKSFSAADRPRFGDKVSERGFAPGSIILREPGFYYHQFLPIEANHFLHVCKVLLIGRQPTGGHVL
jgi:hypothetical protein